MKEKRVKMTYSEVFEDLKKDKAVNLRSCDFLFALFLKAYPKMTLNWGDNWNEWTNKILTFFAELGKLYEYQVYLNPEYGVRDLNNERTNEYLVDLCWSFEDENDRAFWLDLALESELSGRNVDSIINDFWKLTDVKAYTKVGIFTPFLRDKDRVLEEIQSCVAHHGIRVPTERYLITLILNHGKTEIESKRIEIAGYEINYLGDLREIDSKRFSAKLRKTKAKTKTKSK